MNNPDTNTKHPLNSPDTNTKHPLNSTDTNTKHPLNLWIASDLGGEVITEKLPDPFLCRIDLQEPCMYACIARVIQGVIQGVVQRDIRIMSEGYQDLFCVALLGLTPLCIALCIHISAKGLWLYRICSEG